jgi:surfeit locus 1 family protein
MAIVPRFRLIPFVVTLLLVTLGCSLAYWQTQRAQQKEAIEAKLKARESLPALEVLTPGDMEYRRVNLQGEFVQDWPIYLDNRPMNGKAGIVVMMPFKLQRKSQYVLVARGWVPRNVKNRSAVQVYPTPSGIIQIEGILKAHSGRVLQLGRSESVHPKALLQNLDITDFAKASQLPTYPMIIEQTNDSKDGLLRDWPRASSGAEKHRGYAFQWLALAAMALVFFIATGFRYARQHQ